jgi:hypothetical protein
MLHRYASSSSSTPELKLSPRWLSETKARLGKCIIFGMNAAQVQRAGEVLTVLGREWRELSAGSEGFLTGVGREGLRGQKVVWGEMDSMVGLPRPYPFDGPRGRCESETDGNRVMSTMSLMFDTLSRPGSIGHITLLRTLIRRIRRSGANS